MHAKFIETTQIRSDYFYDCQDVQCIKLPGQQLIQLMSAWRTKAHAEAWVRDAVKVR